MPQCMAKPPETRRVGCGLQPVSSASYGSGPTPHAELATLTMTIHTGVLLAFRGVSVSLNPILYC